MQQRWGGFPGAPHADIRQPDASCRCGVFAHPWAWVVCGVSAAAGRMPGTRSLPLTREPANCVRIHWGAGAIQDGRPPGGQVQQRVRKRVYVLLPGGLHMDSGRHEAVQPGADSLCGLCSNASLGALHQPLVQPKLLCQGDHCRWPEKVHPPPRSHSLTRLQDRDFRKAQRPDRRGVNM